MSTLRYHAGAAPDELALDECVVRWATDAAGRHLRLWFYVRTTDGGEHWYSVPIAPGGSYTEQPRRTWGFARTGAGTWQVSPSIDVKDDRPVAPGERARPSLWHQTPAIVGVPEPSPWSAP